MDLKNFFTPGGKIFTSPRGLRKLFSSQVEKNVQVHMDLETFFRPISKNIYKSTWT